MCETTCAMLVFCMPALPKAFAEQSVLYKFAQSIRTWTRLPIIKSGQSSPLKVPSLPGPGEYQVMGGNEDLLSLDSLQIRGTVDSRPDSSDWKSVNQQDCQLESGVSYTKGIVRTTEVNQQAYPASAALKSNLNERQHPWMKGWR